MAEIEYSVDGGVATILLNRPERKNAFTFSMLEQWAQFLERAQVDDGVRVVVVTGAGGNFCSGVDLADFAAERSTPYADKMLLADKVHVVARAVERFDKPYVAAMTGVAVGAGLDMALMADIRIATDTARFSEAYIRVGLLPGDGGCHLLPRIVGRAKALELLWTGEFFSTSDALQWGMLNRVLPEDSFDGGVQQFVSRLATSAPLATRMIKRATIYGETMSFSASLDMISSHQALIQSTDDSKEAMSAFVEKRDAVFENR